MGVDKKVLSSEEVSLHNSASDCWVIINAKAYNVTNFLMDHPGGDEVLLAAAGKDASVEFENIGHGSAARLMLDEFYIGEIDPPTVATTLSYVPQKKALSSDTESSHFITKLLFLPVVVLAVAIVGIHLYS